MNILRILKRNIYKFGKNEIFENVLPLKSEKYFLNLIKTTKQKAYLGIDPTAQCLQIGNLFPLIALLRMWKDGNDIITLVGGATGKIGDPTDRTCDRDKLNHEKVESYSSNIMDDLGRITKNCQKYYSEKDTEWGSCEIMNNTEWMRDINLIDFLEDVVANFRFNDIKNKKSFANRLKTENSINMKEFFYPFLQAYDWLHLHQKYDCRIQIGGDDQQGNIHFGQILIEKMTGESVYGLTVPLFTVNGVKVGKSSTKSRFCLWLGRQQLSPYSLFTELLHLPHSIILDHGLISRLTMIQLDEARQIIADHQKDPSKCLLQTTLAKNIILLVYGAPVLETVQLAHGVFSHSSVPHITSQLKLANGSAVFRANVLESVPHLVLEPGSQQMRLDEEIVKTGLPIRFNGETLTQVDTIDLRDQLKHCAEDGVAGVLEIGPKKKWMVLKHKSNQS